MLDIWRLTSRGMGRLDQEPGWSEAGREREPRGTTWPAPGWVTAAGVSLSGRGSPVGRADDPTTADQVAAPLADAA